MPDEGTHSFLVILIFDPQNRLLLRQDDSGGPWLPTLSQSDVPVGEVETVAARLIEIFTGQPTPVTRGFTLIDPKFGPVEVFFARSDIRTLRGDPDQPEATPFSIDELTALSAQTGTVSPLVKAMIPGLRTHAVRIGYLNLSDRDYIYRFRTDRQRNRDAYLLDTRARSLYLSPLCEAIKQVKRNRERTSAEPSLLDGVGHRSGRGLSGAGQQVKSRGMAQQGQIFIRVAQVIGPQVDPPKFWIPV